MDPIEARQDAEKRFGNLKSIKSDCLKIHCDNHVAMKALNCLLAIVIAFGLGLRLTSSTRGIGPSGDLIVISALLLRLLMHLRLRSSPDLETRFLFQSKRQEKGP
jgi:hypothetical protein